MIKLDNILNATSPAEAWEDLKGFTKAIKDISGDCWDALKTIAKFLNYLMHPSLIFKGLWYYTQLYSFWICLFIALISAILYGFGFKKFGKYVPFSLAIYSLIRMIATSL